MQLAELDKYSVETYPEPANFIQQLLEQNKESYFDTHMKTALGDLYSVLGTMQLMMQPRRLDQCIYTRVPFELNVR